MLRQINVVGAVVVRDGKILCAQRGPAGSLPGLWEFPGGKIEPGESARDALQREIDEELQCLIEVGAQIVATTHAYDFGIVNLTTFYCKLLSGEPILTEHANILWLAPEFLDSITWAPADIEAVEQIKADIAK